MAFTLKTVSSLEKVLPAAEIAEEEKYGEMLSNEKFAFQVVGNSDLTKSYQGVGANPLFSTKKLKFFP